MQRRPLSLAAIAPALLALGAAPEGPVSFKADVAPILVRSCLGCHGGKGADGGLDLSTFARLRSGGKMYGDLILEPGDPDASALIELVRPEGEPRMPYKLDPLDPEAIRTLERWVAQGATFDGLSEADTLLASLVDPLRLLPRVEVQVPTSDPVAATAFSPDGTRLAAAVGRDVLVFGVESGKPVATLADHPGPVNALRFRPDGKTLIAAGGRPGQFGALTIWDLERNARRHDLRGHADTILAADLAPDGRTLATGGYDGLVMLWDIEQGNPIRTLKEHTDAVYAVAFAPDGRTLASAGADRSVKLWNLETGKNRRTLSEATAELYALAFAPDGRTLVTGGVDRTIRAYRVDGPGSAELTRTVVAHEGPILRLVAAPGGADPTLYSSGEDRTVRAWDLPSLQPRPASRDQADWPLALAVGPKGLRLAIGRYDGSIALREPDPAQPPIILRSAPEPKATSKDVEKPAKPDLVREPTLGAPNPRGATRGRTVRVTLTGAGVGEAREVLIPEPGLSATIVPAAKPNPNQLVIDLAIAPGARPGLHRIGVQTPLGIPDYQTFAVSAYPEFAGAEPDDDPAKAKVVPLPATLTGTIKKPGDVDAFRFEVEAGRPLVVESQARALGSTLMGRISLIDESGRVVAEASGFEDRPDPILAYLPERSGSLTLRVEDANFGGSGNHMYRIQAGPIAQLEAAFPLGVEPGGSVEVRAAGVHLASGSIRVEAAADAVPGSLIEAAFEGADGVRPSETPMLVVAEGPQAIESETGDRPEDPGGTLAVPGGVSGRSDRKGDVDHFRFEAKRGDRLIVEVFGRRLGSPIDPTLEVLDSQGQPVPRAVLRPMARTEVAFRDHDSTRRGIRLTHWEAFAVGDYLLFGRELSRMAALPRNPDDDAAFWGVGVERKAGSRRVAFLETTPEQHPQGQPVDKVEIHPPGTTFPPGGLPPVTLPYRNDDGGPGFEGDSRLTFDPPADGTYLARVEDVRGQGGARFGYQLVVRRPRPGFTVTLGPADPNVPRGGSTIVTASVNRHDGFEGPIEVTLDDLPPGLTATTATIERDAFEAELLLSADASAPETSPPTWRAVARGWSAGESESIRREVRRESDPGGRITVTPAPELVVSADPERVAIRPGGRAEVTFRVRRGEGLTGRVPIDVQNLPRGVRVLDIGLNGVLVTESQAERTVTLFAEPWSEPGERPFYASGRLEVLGPPKAKGLGARVVASSRDFPSGPIQLVILPPDAVAGDESSPGAESRSTASAGSR